MDEYIKQLKEAGINGRELKEYIKEERERQVQIEKEEKDRQDRREREEKERQEREKERQDRKEKEEKDREHEIRMLEIQQRTNQYYNKNKSTYYKKFKLPDFTNRRNNIDNFIESKWEDKEKWNDNRSKYEERNTCRNKWSYNQEGRNTNYNEELKNENIKENVMEIKEINNSKENDENQITNNLIDEKTTEDSLCLEDAACDLLIGNLEGVRESKDPKKDWKPKEEVKKETLKEEENLIIQNIKNEGENHEEINCKNEEESA